MQYGVQDCMSVSSHKLHIAAVELPLSVLPTAVRQGVPQKGRFHSDTCIVHEAIGRALPGVFPKFTAHYTRVMVLIVGITHTYFVMIP